ncbi:MAG: hypothetical protein ACFCGT_27175 [Sandaracinaceae bacterium]
MTATLRWMSALALVVGLTACGNRGTTEPEVEPEVEPEETVEVTEPEVTEPEATEEPAAEAVPTPAQLPLPEDFAAEAEESITADNLEEQLAALEAEIARELP